VFCEAAFQNNIIVIAFPSKCTHKLQPLNIVVFAQTQHHWSAHCNDRIIHHVKMDRYNIIPKYMEIRLHSMTPELMHSALSTIGIFPFNDALFTDDDFAPAKSFSHSMHTPTSFPLKVPSSPPISSDLSNLEMSDNESSAAECVAADTTEAQACDTWDTDSDDFDYGTSAAAPAPTEALPSPLTIPVTGTDTSSQCMQATLAPPICASYSSAITPSMPPFCASPTVSQFGGVSQLPCLSDTTSVDPHASHKSPYYTRSQSQVSQIASHRSLPAVSLSTALDPTWAQAPLSSHCI